MDQVMPPDSGSPYESPAASEHPAPDRYSDPATPLPDIPAPLFDIYNSDSPLPLGSFVYIAEGLADVPFVPNLFSPVDIPPPLHNNSSFTWHPDLPNHVPTQTSSVTQMHQEAHAAASGAHSPRSASPVHDQNQLPTENGLNDNATQDEYEESTESDAGTVAATPISQPSTVRQTSHTALSDTLPPLPVLHPATAAVIHSANGQPLSSETIRVRGPKKDHKYDYNLLTVGVANIPQERVGPLMPEMKKGIEWALVVGSLVSVVVVGMVCIWLGARGVVPGAARLGGGTNKVAEAFAK